MTPGTILCDTRFPYSDGTFGKKLLIILNDGTNYPYIVVRTTKHQKNRGTTYGCQNHDRFPNFYLPKHSCYLKLDTWIQLEDFRELNPIEVLNRHYDGILGLLAKLPDTMTPDLLRCAIE